VIRLGHHVREGSYSNVQGADRLGSSVAGWPRLQRCPGPSRSILSQPHSTNMSTTKPRTFFGRLWRSVLLGVADGVPGVSQVVTAVENFHKKDAPPVGPRLVVGWTTVALMGMLIAAKLWGGFGWDELLRLLGVVVAF
jgi:hypothetical protein